MSAYEPGKKFEDWTWNDLQEYCEGEILKQLLAGKLKHGVWIVTNTTLSWKENQNGK